jgi:Mg-chelatase subunit ChlD
MEQLFSPHFISQSFTDIQRKLKQAECGPQTPQGDLMKMAFKVFITELRLETTKRPSFLLP